MPDQKRTVFITGSGKNIGRAAALLFAKHGYNVAINGARDSSACQDVAAEVRKLGAAARVFMGDVGEKGRVTAIAREALFEFGTIDAFIANAALRPHTPFLDISEDEWRRVMATNLDSSFFFCQAFLPQMIAQKWGRIVLLTGRHAIRGTAGNATVATSKHGVWGLTKTLAREFGSSGITVNAVSPGSIMTERDDEAWVSRRQQGAKEIPVGRIGTPQEIAEVYLFLCSDGAAFLNGQMVGVNGGIET